MTKIRSTYRLQFRKQSDVTASRAKATTYQNTTGAPLLVCINIDLPAGTTGSISTGDSGASIVTSQTTNSITGVTLGTAQQNVEMLSIVSPNFYYDLTGSAGISILRWIEWS